MILCCQVDCDLRRCHHRVHNLLLGFCTAEIHGTGHVCQEGYLADLGVSHNNILKKTVT